MQSEEHTTDMIEDRRTSKDDRGTESKHEAIVQAAIRLFAEHGFERTTTKMIAREAGVAEGTIYIYFPTKKHILLAFVERTGLESLKDTFKRTEGLPTQEMIHAFLLNRFKVWQENGSLMKVIFAEALFDRDLAEQFCSRITRPATQLVEEYLIRRRREGPFGEAREVNPEIAARALVGQFFGIVLLYDALLCESDNRFTAEEYAVQLTQLFLQGMEGTGK